MTPRDPVAPSGSLAQYLPHDVLRWCEARRFTGTLRFSVHGAVSEIPLLAGVPELTGEGDPVGDALERFLALADGRYDLVQTLPPLDDQDTAPSLVREGSLEGAHVGDLMHYCEATGLTGLLTLRHGGQVRDGDSLPGEERTCAARYYGGELVSLTLDGQTDADIAAVFEWADGAYVIAAHPAWEPDAGAERKPTGEALLRTLEVAIADILEKSSRSRTPSWRAPSLRPDHRPEGLRPRTEVTAPSTADTTVKVYFVQARPVVPARIPADAPLPDAPDAPDTPDTPDAPDAPSERSVAEGVPAAAGALSVQLTRTELVLAVVLAVGVLSAVAIVAGLLARS